MSTVSNKLRKLAAATVSALRSSVLFRVYDPDAPKNSDEKTVNFDTLQHAIRDFGGGLGVAYRLVAGNVTVTGDDFFINVNPTAAARTVTLPSAATLTGRMFAIRSTSSSNTVTIDPDGSETINGASTVVLKAVNDYILFVSDGTNWQRIAATITP
jgi:hypothetical protein